MPLYQEMKLFERVRSWGLLGESVSLGVRFEVPKAHAKPRVCLLARGSVCISQLLLQGQACCHIPHHGDNGLNL